MSGPLTTGNPRANREKAVKGALGEEADGVFIPDISLTIIPTRYQIPKLIFLYIAVFG